jgi:hypothetical protein
MILRIAIPFLFLLSVTDSVDASSFFEQPFPDTVRAAPAIVRGKIGKSSTEWTTLSDGSKHLFTYYDVDVKEGLKGGPRSGAPIRIRELGGSKEGVTLQVSGTAQFETGEDVVVMLGDSSSAGDGSYPVQGMMMGKYNLEKGSDGKEYLRGAGLASTAQAGVDKNPVVTLEKLREIIHEQASESGVKAPSGKPAPLAANSGLLSARGTVGPGPRTEIHDENLRQPTPTPRNPMKPALLGFGVLIAVAWFLKSQKKRG